MKPTVTVTNTHKEQLPIAGVNVNAGRSAVVDARKFSIFKRSQEGKSLLERGLVKVETPKVAAKTKPEAKAD